MRAFPIGTKATYSAIVQPEHLDEAVGKLDRLLSWVKQIAV